jgi:predicted AlkP superfamily pyrophosphatase or phosphodiesterase
MASLPGGHTRRTWTAVLVPAVALASLAGCTSPDPPPDPPQRHLLIVVDGLRPDYVTPDVMPHLTGLGQRGVVFTRHHAVYPTVTRVNASSLATGAYPEAHGLMGNAVFFPRVDPAGFLDTGDRHALEAIVASGEPLLTAVTLGEALHDAGRRLLVVSSGTSGSALLNNPTVAGGAILHHAYTLPGNLGEALAQSIGPPPAADAPRTAFDRYAVDAFLEVGLPRVDPAVTVMWLGALDSTAHATGVGSPDTVAVLRHVDREIARIEHALEARGLLDQYNIWITSDHGFSTHVGAPATSAVLAPFADTLPDGAPAIVSAGGAIHVRTDDHATVAAIVRALQQTPGVGAIFTRATQPGSFDGAVPGTLSFDVVRWDHPRAAHILFSPDWTDDANAYGFPGTAASGGTAGHGSTSPWDVHNTLIAAGPGLERGVTIDTPSGNVDFAPTFLRLLGIEPPASVQGRPLEEAFRSAVARAAEVRVVEHTVHAPDGSYSVTSTSSIVSIEGREYRYFDGARVTRPPTMSPSPAP